MAKLEQFCCRKRESVSGSKIDGHEIDYLEIEHSKFDSVVSLIAEDFLVQYFDPDFLENNLKKLGRETLAKIILQKLPEEKKVRSGDMGEILASRYVKENTSYDVPIHKLRYGDSRDMPMRGDDIIAIKKDSEEKLEFLKGEAKSRNYFDKATIEEARKALDNNDGNPDPSSLLFIAERLAKHEPDNELSSELLKFVGNTPISQSQVLHMVFAFTGNDAFCILEQHLKTYSDSIKQLAVGLQVKEHQKFIQEVYDKAKPASK